MRGMTGALVPLLVLLAPTSALARDNTTSLIEAARKGEVHTVKKLLAKGADVNAKDQSGRTALMEAALSVPPAMVVAPE